MHYLIQFQINVFSLAILGILYFFMHKSRIQTFSKRLLTLSVITTAIAIIDEPLTWIFDSMLFPGAYFLEYGTNFLLFLVGPLIAGFLMSYVDYRMFQDRIRIKKRMFYQHATIFTAIMLVFNFFFPLYFSVSPLYNSYSSGPYKTIHYLLLGAVYGYFFVFVTVNRKQITKKETLIYQVFFFIPIVGMLLQLIDSRLHFSWTSLVLGLLVMYVFLESTPSDEDYLTKLYNRNSFDTYLHHLIQENSSFGLFVFDLNFFKEINDKYGHEAGDKTLIFFADALRYAFNRTALAFRLGGDEFAAIVDSDDVESYLQAMRKFLQKQDTPYMQDIRFSYGFHMHEQGMSADELNRIADYKMYALKKEMKMAQDT